ncbi:MAG: hypothetical protein LBH44_00735 [Treponema sp.]|nr:hypothetical protein [Treponema sp.]
MTAAPSRTLERLRAVFPAASTR